LGDTQIIYIPSAIRKIAFRGQKSDFKQQSKELRLSLIVVDFYRFCQCEEKDGNRPHNNPFTIFFPHHTPTNSSSTCKATPPIINNMHPTTGIVDTLNMLVMAVSPIQPNTPKTIIMVGGVRAVTIPMSLAFIYYATSIETIYLGDFPLFPPHQWLWTSDLKNNSQKSFAGNLLFHPFHFANIPLLVFPFCVEQDSCNLSSTPRPNGYKTNIIFLESNSNYTLIIPYNIKSFINLFIFINIYNIILYYCKLYETIYKIWETILSIEFVLTIHYTYSNRVVSRYLLSGGAT